MEEQEEVVSLFFSLQDVWILGGWQLIPMATELVDAVTIATPNPLHVEQAQQCLAAGMTVLIEKPLAESLQSA